ncbi:hypothetical protein [Rubricoccus marinus]|uniref:HNH nuclease domain-containing protein n=1 Tax=Rubricoccus marinus TaxID=716817 RepID=A0A259TXA7_9BACT|nr:hypothetical protein [Rubricoccus marinus]OZC02402.1 hypothetical protein BSZ36_05080 [Rubricoccus marinus]
MIGPDKKPSRRRTPTGPRREAQPKTYSEKDRARFWAKVAEPDENGCRVWNGALSKAGRGRLSIDGVTRYAYVYALELADRPVAKGEPVRHLCGNPSCCEETHLTTEGGQSANCRDTVRHGRHNTAVLTEADAFAIRIALAGPSPPTRGSLAERYGVSGSAISAVATGKTFKDAGGPIKTSRKRKSRGETYRSPEPDHEPARTAPGRTQRSTGARPAPS